MATRLLLAIAAWACLVAGTARAQSLYTLGNTDSPVKQYNSATGAFVSDFTTVITSPNDITFGTGGDLFVSRSTGDVERFNGTTGVPMGTFVSGLTSAKSIAFGPGGDLFVFNTASSEIFRFHGTTGAPMGVFASGGVPAFNGYQMRYSPHVGDFFVIEDFVEGNVHRYDGTTGAYEGVFVAAGNVTRGLTIGPDGDLYLTRADGFHDVRRYDGTTGAFEGVFASGSGLSVPFGLTFGPGDDLFVTSAGSNQVLRYDGLTGAFEGIAATGGGLSVPGLVAFAPVPEPGSVLLVCGAAVAFARWRRARA